MSSDAAGGRNEGRAKERERDCNTKNSLGEEERDERIHPIKRLSVFSKSLEKQRGREKRRH